MEKIVIITDSTCDLSDKLIKDNNIKVIPLYVSFGEKIFKDREEIQPQKLYDMVKEGKKLPKTSSTSVGAIIMTFSKYLEEGYDVFYVGIGSKLSTTYGNALLAKEELNTDRVQISDGCNLSTGTGLLVLKACKLAKEGKSAKQIKEKIDELVPFVRSKFVVDSLEYLYKGGRCSALKRFVGTLFQLKPVIAVNDGKLDVLVKTRGKRKGLQVMLDDIVANKDNIHKDCVMVTHTFAEEEAHYLYEELKKEIPDAHIEITSAGCVISSHCGKGTIGILYIMK